MVYTALLRGNNVGGNPILFVIMNKRLDWREDMDEYIRLVNKTEDYIESHLSEKISLDDLANHANMSKYHFHRLFRKYSDETAKQFVTRIKVERSGIFLTVRHDLSITDIALQYGYNDASTFNKAFKKYIGMSPLEYRKARNDKK